MVRFLTCDQITTAAFSFMDGIDRKKTPCTKSDLYPVALISPFLSLGDCDCGAAADCVQTHGRPLAFRQIAVALGDAVPYDRSR